MKKLICGSLVALTAASSAVAMGNDFYGRFDVGYMISAKKFSNGNAYNQGKKSKHAPVYNVGVGYKFSDDVRSEFTLSYRDFKYEDSGTTSKQKIKNYTLFVNGFYDFKNDSTFTPYVTAGVGYAHNKAGSLVDSSNTYAGKKNGSFAWNVGFGSKFNLNQNFDIDLAYRYADLGKVKLTDADTLNLAGKAVSHKAHEITLGLIYNF